MCPDINFLKIVPLEHVPRDIQNTFMDLIAREDIYKLSKREQFWIKKLNTMIPFGLNKRQDVPPPIPFIHMFNDHSGKINQIVKKFFNEFAVKYMGCYHSYQVVTANKRNKNLKDSLVSSTIKS